MLNDFLYSEKSGRFYIVSYVVWILAWSTTVLRTTENIDMSLSIQMILLGVSIIAMTMPIASQYLIYVTSNNIDKIRQLFVTLYGFALLSIPYVYTTLEIATKEIADQNLAIYWVYVFTPIFGIFFLVFDIVHKEKTYFFNLATHALVFFYSGFLVFFCITLLVEFLK